MHLRSSLAVLFTLVVAPCAQGWTLIAPAAVPNPRTSPAVEAEPAGATSTLMFGGLQTNPTVYLADTWRYDGTTWTQLSPANVPSGRVAARMASSPLANTLVLYGGVRPGALGDTWTWDGTDWTLRDPGLTPGIQSPQAVLGGAFVYDVRRHKAVLFGGQSAARVLLAETWEYDVATHTWARVTTATVPTARSEAMMAYDLARGQCVMFGGKVFNGTTNLQVQETWVYDGADWTQLTPHNSPCARSGEDCMTYDHARNVVVLHAGNTLVVGSSRCAPDQTWEWDGGDWYLTAPAALPAGAGQTGGIGWNRARASVVHFGGQLGSSQLNDTTLYGGRLPYFATFGRGCVGSAGTPRLAPTTLPAIGGTLNLAFTGIVPGASVLLLSGGTNPTGPLDLSPLGMTGCSLYLNLATLAAQLPVSGSSFGLGPIPLPGGAVLELQLANLDLAANPLGLTASNGGRAVTY